jgi:hypothetical protein
MKEVCVKGLKIIASIFSAVLLTQSAAFAAIPYTTAWYVELNPGYSAVNGVAYPGKVYHSGFGGNITFGYKFNPYIGLDVGYTYYSDVRIKAPTGQQVAFSQHYSYDMAAKLMLPIAQTGVNVFGRGGMGRIRSYTHVKNEAVANLNHYTFNAGVHTRTVPVYGAGAEYAILKNLEASMEWMRAQGNNTTGQLDLYSLGLTYLF